VVTLKLAVVAFAAIATVAGTVAADGLLLVSVIKAPAAGAGPFSVNVPVDQVPPTTDVGRREIDNRVAAVTVKDAL
jgi:hypothetical protein